MSNRKVHSTTSELAGLDHDLLARVAREHMLWGHLIDRALMPELIIAVDITAMESVAIDEWMGASPNYTQRMRRLMGIEGDTVGDLMKALQLDAGFVHGYMDVGYRLIDERQGEFWLEHCGALVDAEPMGELQVVSMCHHIEDPTFDATAAATNPRGAHPADPSPSASPRRSGAGVPLVDRGRPLERPAPGRADHRRCRPPRPRRCASGRDPTDRRRPRRLPRRLPATAEPRRPLVWGAEGGGPRIRPSGASGGGGGCAGDRTATWSPGRGRGIGGPGRRGFVGRRPPLGAQCPRRTAGGRRPRSPPVSWPGCSPFTPVAGRGRGDCLHGTVRHDVGGGC